MLTSISTIINAGTFPDTYRFSQWRWEGGRRGHAPRAALCRGRHFEGRKYETMKFGYFWRIGVCIADSDIFTTPNTPNTPPVLGPRPLIVNAPRPHIKKCVHQETYTVDQIEHSPAVKLLKIHIVELLFYRQSQFNVLHCSHV